MVSKQDLNVYTVMLIASFLALLIGCIALAIEMNRYESTTPWKVSGAGITMVQPFEIPSLEVQPVGESLIDMSESSIA